MTRGEGFLIGLLCAVARIPAATQSAAPGFGLAVRATRTGERWARSFAGQQPFVSYQWAQNGWLCERILVMTLTFKVDAKPDGLRLILTRCHLFGVPLPQALHPIIQTLESECDDRVSFDVTAKLPTGHLIVHYRGTLSRLTP